MAISSIDRAVPCAGLTTAKRGIARLGLPLCLSLFATSAWGMDVNCSGGVYTDIAGRAAVIPEAVKLNNLSSCLQSPVIGVEQNVTVICPGDSIQSAIDIASPIGHLNIIIDGTCTEDVTVMRDEVTFEGSTNGGELKGTFNAIGARSIRMTNLSVTAPLGRPPSSQ